MTAFLPLPAEAGALRSPYRLNKSDCDALGAELDAIRRRVMADLGEADVRYIKRMVRMQRSAEISGRLVLFLGFHPLAWCVGVLLLALSKILDNMEIGHNIMHGQYNWTNDPALRGKSFEWDSACPGEQWRHSHNYIHHTHTNILGKDRDIGYGILRMADAQPWKPKHLFQPVRAFLMMLIFEWGVAMHDLEMDRLRSGEVKWQDMRGRFWQSIRKMGWQGLKDYVVFPLLAFPIFLNVLLANLAANLIRNIWAFIIIFCGHFTDEVEMFTEEETRHESRGQWYVRQMLGSANISGGRLFHILSGHLSHQIEHHLFPDMPAHRYAVIAPEVEALCQRYGLPYNTGPLSAQFFTVIQRILRLSFPSAAPSHSLCSD
ncbi:MAG: acyl-CoA desaturase [Pedobacter sp.]|nr:acyl-CoA desaturase [Pedobacter sp.]